MINTKTDSYAKKYSKRLINDIFTIIREYKLPYPNKNLYTMDILELQEEYKIYFLKYKEESYKRLLDKKN